VAATMTKPVKVVVVTKQKTAASACVVAACGPGVQNRPWDDVQLPVRRQVKRVWQTVMLDFRPLSGEAGSITTRVVR
jgi:hypothetical protein